MSRTADSPDYLSLVVTPSSPPPLEATIHRDRLSYRQYLLRFGLIVDREPSPALRSFRAAFAMYNRSQYRILLRVLPYARKITLLLCLHVCQVTS